MYIICLVTTDGKFYFIYGQLLTAYSRHSLSFFSHLVNHQLRLHVLNSCNRSTQLMLVSKSPQLVKTFYYLNVTTLRSRICTVVNGGDGGIHPSTFCWEEMPCVPSPHFKAIVLHVPCCFAAFAISA